MPESLVISGAGLSFSGEMFLNPFYGTVPRGNAFYAGNATGSGETTYTFVVPSNVYSISYVVISSGESGYVQTAANISLGGAGGGLAYRNNVPVTPGESVTVVVGNSHSRKYGDGIDQQWAPNSSVTVNGVSTIARGPINLIPGFPAGTYDGGAKGGEGYTGPTTATTQIVVRGGGGAAGYTKNGGNSSAISVFSSNLLGKAAILVGGGGGGGMSFWYRAPGSNINAGGGGGVNVFGLGSDGAGGTLANSNGGGGSWNIGPILNNGNAYISIVTPDIPPGSMRNNGGLYGGGGAGYLYRTSGVPTGNFYLNTIGGRGGPGAVRIVWGFKRAFPSTDVSDDITGNDAVVYL